ncbi:MAG TPA: hypothetical protein VHF25_05990 [Nitriliruptorales bacterium]|nr:hypothetical protein [Nitriliruptorales bacterium]
MNRARAVATVHGATIVGALALLLWTNVAVGGGQWFSGDDWDFLVNRRLTSLDDLLRPHNEHWSTLPVVVFRLTFAAVGLHAYWPYLLPALLAHGAIAHLAWRLMCRAGVDPWVATALSGAYLLVGAGHENLLWAFQVGSNGAVALGLWHVLLVDHDGPPDGRDLAGTGVGSLALATSTVAVALVAAAGLTGVLRRRLRAAALAVGPPTALFLLWFVAYGRAGLASHSDLHSRSLPGTARYVWEGLGGGLEDVTGLEGAGPVLVVGLLVAAVARVALAHERGGRRPPRSSAASLATAVAAVLLLALIAIGRTGAGVALARSPRYVHMVTALLLPGAGLALTALADDRWWRRTPVLAALVAVGLHGWGLLVDAAGITAASEQDHRDTLLASAVMAGSGAPLVATADTHLTPDLQLGELEQLERRGALPPPTGVGPLDRLQASAQLQLALETEPLAPFGQAPLPRLVGTSFGPVPPAPGGCATVATGPDAQIAIAFEDPGAVALRSAVGGPVHADLADRDGRRARASRRWELPGSQVRYLSVSLGGATVYLTVPPTTALTLCGVAGQ